MSDGEHETASTGGQLSSADGSHCYILCKATAGNGAVLAIAAGEIYVSVAEYKIGDDTQLWQRWALADGAYALINKATRLCLFRQGPMGDSLVLVPFARAAADPFGQWRDDKVPGDYNAINSLADWEQKINLAGDGPYYPGQLLTTWTWSRGAPNELWKQQSAGDPSYTLASLAFDTAKARIDKLAPLYGNGMSVTNSSLQPAAMPISTDQLLTTAYGFQPVAGSPDIQIGYHGPRPALDMNQSVVLLDGDWQYAANATAGVLQPFHTVVSVPARTGVGYAAMESCAQLTLPYTAKFNRLSPGGGSDTIEVSGSFSAMCPYGIYAQFLNSWPVD